MPTASAAVYPDMAATSSRLNAATYSARRCSMMSLSLTANGTSHQYKLRVRPLLAYQGKPLIIKRPVLLRSIYLGSTSGLGQNRKVSACDEYHTDRGKLDG